MPLLVAVQILGGLCLLLAGLCGWLLWRQRRLEATQAAALAEQQQLGQVILTLGQRLDANQKINLRLVRELQELRELKMLVMPLAERLARLEQQDAGSLSSAQASQLMDLGVTAEELGRVCGLSRAEAELLDRIHARVRAG